jgi:hypothetical protein
MKLQICFSLIITVLLTCIACEEKIDRAALVTRHNITHSGTDSLSSLTVGNGEFAFTADITGLQTFPNHYERGIPLGTMSQWGWHSFPNPENYTLDDVARYYKVGQDSVPYWYQYSKSSDERKIEATNWLRENPHRLHLGLIGLEMLKDDSTRVEINDIRNPKQHLNLWTGELISEFEIEGILVKVNTLCHQELDMIAVRIESDLIKKGRLSVKLNFPYARHEKFSPGYDLNSPDKHTTRVEDSGDSYTVFERSLDDDKYYTRMDWLGVAEISELYEHIYLLQPKANDTSLECQVIFSDQIPDKSLPSYTETTENNKVKWRKFWESGGAIDFSSCTDPRAFELERRVVLSQYLTKIQCSGSLPPQETGLTYNSWHGKFHLEMHWWHALHFILWKRPELIEEQMDYYYRVFEKARETAVLQGYDGVRWQKMTDPWGRESPSNVGPFLIWQQPHIIYYTELLYKYYNEDKDILNKYKMLLFATADFMASYARYDSTRSEYILGPALIPAQERFSPATTINPTFELAYWYWGLKTAQLWRERLELPPDKTWQHVIDNLAPMPVQNKLYLFTENATDSYTNQHYLTDHPMVLGTIGFLPPSPRLDRAIMNNTLDKVQKVWHWETCWGWDFPLLAMNASALDRSALAVDMLLMDTQKNSYLVNGHNYQEARLSLYLPGNGGLLTAVAMMCTYLGEDGKNGFPSDGSWDVKFENLQEIY